VNVIPVWQRHTHCSIDVGNVNRSPASHDDSLHSEGLPDFGPDFDVDIPEIDREVAPSAGDDFPDFGPTFPLEPSALFSCKC
jgi:hypothetical protein